MCYEDVRIQYTTNTNHIIYVRNIRWAALDNIAGDARLGK